ncbi:hypothetical protein PF004_g20367 [Phytophthora fragariae]|uniref:DUF6818 domain-containing protein n=1 Tax=Phytophthora fragariae TaxID=53985 RepID=A0A6G0N628_9STRA|nr:hypothetical protein PF004_g20367 [Phytophthora fragariae]
MSLQPLTFEKSPLTDKCPTSLRAATTKTATMVHLVHSAVHWSSRCIVDTSSDDENVSSNLQRGGVQAPAESAKSSSPASTSSTGTSTPPWMSPRRSLRVPKEVSNPPPAKPSTAAAAASTPPPTDPRPPATPPATRNPRNPTTSSPVLLEDPPASRPRSPSPWELCSIVTLGLVCFDTAVDVSAERPWRQNERALPTASALSLRAISPCRLQQATSSAPSSPPPTSVLMAKQTGSTNYKLSEVRRLLALVEHYLPLGKDEWERLAVAYNSNRGRGVAERDHESLCRKFKVLYGARKPTGVAEMPPHVKQAKLLKQSIDAKASVVDMDYGADVDNEVEEEGENEEEEEEYEADLCFDFEGDEGLGHNSPVGDDADTSERASMSDSMHSGEAQTSAGDNTHVNSGDFSELLRSAGVYEGLEAFATPRPSPPAAQSTQRKLRSSATKKTGQGPSAAGVAAASTATTDGANATSGSQPATAGRSQGKKPSKQKPYATSCNRLGGINLAEFRDTVGRKCAADEDEELAEASYAKVKRVKAVRATTELKKRLSDLESSSSNMGGTMFEMLLMMREENERKAELRRTDEEQRRRDELAAREARYLADKAETEERSRLEKQEAEERRRQEKQEAEERARRDKEDARARTQELLLILGALTKKE